MSLPRRSFLQQLSTGLGAISFLPSLMARGPAHLLEGYAHLSPQQLAREEDFWYRIQQAYTASPNVINLNNGAVSPQPKVVQDAIRRYTELSNEGPGYYMWRIVGKGREAVRGKLAQMGGCDPEEIALHRNATESLETVIFGLKLSAGDEFIMADQDYPSMRSAVQQRAAREGIVIKEVTLPIDYQDDQEIIERYVAAMGPRTRAILLTHMIHYTGQILPVRPIAEAARSRGIDVIVDAAHSFAHLDFKIPDLGCDYLGVSLHKWLCAPFGTGMLYVRKEKIQDLWPLFGAGENHDVADIRKFEHTGTYSYPHEMAIGHAIDFHEGIGTARKQARLDYLKRYWAEQVVDLPGAAFNIPWDKTCGIAHLSIHQHDPAAIYNALFRDHNVYTMRYQLEGKLDGIRVSPHVYTRLADLDRLVAGLHQLMT